MSSRYIVSGETVLILLTAALASDEHLAVQRHSLSVARVVQQYLAARGFVLIREEVLDAIEAPRGFGGPEA